MVNLGVFFHFCHFKDAFLMNPPRDFHSLFTVIIKKGPFWEGSNYAKVFRTHSALFGYAWPNWLATAVDERFWGHFRFGHRRLRVSFSQSRSTAGAADIPLCVALGWWLNGFGDTSQKTQTWFDMDGWKWCNKTTKSFLFEESSNWNFTSAWF